MVGEEHAGHPEAGVLGQGFGVLAGVWLDQGDQREREREAWAQTQQRAEERNVQRADQALGMGSGPWERSWSAGPVEAKEDSQLDISECQWFWPGRHRGLG